MIYVVDASVGIKWFLDEPDGLAARQLLNEMGSPGMKFLVPELFFFEVYSVCMRRHPNPSQFANEGMALLWNVPLARIPMTKELAKIGAKFVAFGLTGYDAVYAALAQHVDGVWCTYDKDATKKLKNPSRVKLLG